MAAELAQRTEEIFRELEDIEEDEAAEIESEGDGELVLNTIMDAEVTEIGEEEEEMDPETVQQPAKPKYKKPVHYCDVCSISTPNIARHLNTKKHRKNIVASSDDSAITLKSLQLQLAGMDIEIRALKKQKRVITKKKEVEKEKEAEITEEAKTVKTVKRVNSPRVPETPAVFPRKVTYSDSYFN